MKLKEMIGRLFSSERKVEQLQSNGIKTVEDVELEGFVRSLLTYDANCITVNHAIGSPAYLYRHRGSYRDKLYEFTRSHWELISGILKSKASEMSDSLDHCVYEGYPFGKVSIISEKVSDSETNLYLYVMN